MKPQSASPYARSACFRLAPVALALALAAALPPAYAQNHGHDHARPADASDDPFKPVYIVTSRQTFDAGVQSLAKNASGLSNAIGKPLVIAELKTHQLPDLIRHVHENEKRCGGYFAFDSRREAEDFVKADRSREAIETLFATYTVDNQATVNPWLSQVSEANIRGTINHLSTQYPNRYYASTHGRTSATWIKDTWLALANGRSDVSAELYTGCTNCSTQPSAILTIQGSELPNEVVVLGAHLDSISSSGSGDAMNAPGADDDASGIATLTEVLRVALASGYKPKRTIKFMGYAAEEVGLRGSKAIATDFKNRGVNVVGVLQLDMTNYRNGGANPVRLVTDYSNSALQQFLRDLHATYLGGTLGSYTCGYGCSDHASWTSSGFPAAIYFESGTSGGGYSPYIHSPSDTLANMGNSAANSVPFAKLGLAFVGELGKTAGSGPGPGPGTQTYSNATAYAINDNATVDSPIPVSGRTGNGPANAQVYVSIVHTYRGDLKVDLVAPDGSLYNLHNRSGGSADNLEQTYTVDVSSEALNGQWKLRVNDNGPGDTGRIVKWSITF
ncbi:M20/M25/M40 family metallo-hydrolase [Lysobacter yananisis]|uniref:M20/M25/M40 family metallo-hydrolase n=1 Tax=Lysobacter yananisis TaxID=1003114 RepID=A0ABY9P2C7_9GAMM|nr:M20/M25/M40 family metallo-hydrolase [Lysobacter yananisis]WMT01071.1 M20/M25/M40 family metallo-hydrolase [Lysobacter yananisis]